MIASSQPTYERPYVGPVGERWQTVPELETPRLRLRMLAMEDVDELYELLADRQVARFIADGQPPSRSEIERAVESILQHWSRERFGRWGAVSKETGRLVGYGGLRSLDGTPELVYILGKRYWGRGLATELADAALRFGFCHFRYDRIVALVRAGNLRSIRVLAKVGLSFETRDCFRGYPVLRYVISGARFTARSHPVRLFMDSDVSQI